MSCSPGACLLLATHDGAKYLAEQMESLLLQERCHVAVFVRDDGSCDGTKELLRQYAARDQRVNVSFGQNVGAAASFMWLVRNAPSDFDAYFFCDQDDIWDLDKCAVAIDALQTMGADLPALYCSRVRYVDEAGGYLGMSPIPERVGLGNALAECVAVGCTMALNRPAIELIREALPRGKITMHDWWCYLILAASDAEIIYDETPHIRYRQHGGNLLGASPSALGTRITRLKRRLKRTGGTVTRSRQASLLLEVLGARMRGEKRLLVEDFIGGKLSLRTRLKLLASRQIRRGNWIDQLILDLQILLNDY